MLESPQNNFQETPTFGREEREEATILHPRGHIGAVTIPTLWAMLRSISEDGYNVVVDLSDVSSIDVGGITALRDAYHLFLQGGQRLLLAASPSQDVLGLTDPAYGDKVMPVFPTVEAALEALHAKSE